MTGIRLACLTLRMPLETKIVLPAWIIPITCRTRARQNWIRFERDFKELNPVEIRMIHPVRHNTSRALKSQTPFSSNISPRCGTYKYTHLLLTAYWFIHSSTNCTLYWTMGHSLLEQKSKMTLEGQRTIEGVTNEKWRDNYSQLFRHEVPRSLHLDRGYNRGDGGVRDPNRQKMRFQPGAVWLLREQAAAVWRHTRTNIHMLKDPHHCRGAHAHTV